MKVLNLVVLAVSLAVFNVLTPAGVFFVICVSVSWKILALDLVNLECLSGEPFGDNHPVTPAWLVSAPEEKKSGGAEGRGGAMPLFP